MSAPALVRDSVAGFADAKVWRLADFGGHVLTSYVCHSWAHETMAFRCTEDGHVTNWADLACVHGRRAHEECAREAVAS